MSTDLYYTNKREEGADKGFLELNEELSNEELLQAYVFRRIDIFSWNNGKDKIADSRLKYYEANQGAPTTPIGTGTFYKKAEGKLPGERIINFYNYNDDGDHANLSMHNEMLYRPGSIGVTRNQIYSRAGFPTSTKRNWSELGNNFRIYKILESTNQADPSEPIDVEFFKSIQDENRNTIISVKNISVDFEGTYIDTARSDVLVKISYTMDSFDLMDLYYNADGEGPLVQKELTDENLKEYCSVLDLLTPPDLGELEGTNYVSKGIVLEMYTNNVDGANSYNDWSQLHDNRLRFLSWNNHLKLNLYIVDHVMTFDEITNKVDIEIEYRAAADMGILKNRNWDDNILYSIGNRKTLAEKMNEIDAKMNSGCTDAADAVMNSAKDIKKRSFTELIREHESSSRNVKEGWTTEKFEYSDLGEIPNAGGKVPTFTSDSKHELLYDYAWGTDQDGTGYAARISQKLKEMNFPKEGLQDWYLSLHSLLCCFSDQPKYRVHLPVVANSMKIGGAYLGGFRVGDLPINARLFEKWFDKKYLSNNETFYVDFKSFVKDVIMDYINPALSNAFKGSFTLGVSIKDLKGGFINAMNKPEKARYLSNRMNNTHRVNNAYQFHSSDMKTPRVKVNDMNKNYVVLNIHVVNEGRLDHQAGDKDLKKNIGKALEKISENYMVIEGKSPYGPFKSTKLQKNDAEYLREIRSMEQGIQSIAQLGAVYDTTLETYPNCPDFRFFPGEMCYLYIPDFGLSLDETNLAYKLGIGGHQIITKVSHKIEVEDTAKMTSTITMRYWSSGVKNDHVSSATKDSICPKLKTPRKQRPDSSDDLYDDQIIGGWGA